jgi:predicted metal-dependent TIM-barrel fold hydrolase
MTESESPTSDESRMPIFDPHVRTDVRSDDDLKNLAYFDTERVVTTAHPYQPFERAEDLLEYFEWLIDEECERIERCGLGAHAALGVLPEARPRRSHPEVWTAMPELLERDPVVAVGEIGAWKDEEAHWELFERQVRMARDHELPVVVTPPTGLKVNMTYKMMLRIESIGLPPKRAVMNYLDERMVEAVVRDGFVAGLAVGASDLPPSEAADIVVDVLEAVGDAKRIVLNSALRAAGSDVLCIPKTIAALQERGVGRDVIEQLVYDNSATLFLDD